MVKVSVIMASYNYGKYITKAIESVLNQTMKDFELIIVNDGSDDNTKEILKKYEKNPKIKIIHNSERKGHVLSSIEGINKSSGEYIIRLDADDYFDENAILVLSTFLDQNPDVGLVYPDFFQVSDDGKVFDYTMLPKITEFTEVLDVPANGAGTMFRRKYYDEVGGYNPKIKAQDGYDLWLKFVDKYKVRNINLPLFYYRKHAGSITTYPDRLLDARRFIKEQHAEKINGKVKIAAIIPARKDDFSEYVCLRKLNGKSVLSYTIEEAVKTKLLDRVIVTTDDEKIAEEASKHEGVEVIMRPKSLSGPREPIESSVLYIMDKLTKQNYNPNVFLLLHVSSPFRKERHIAEAINTLLLYNLDSVISVRESKDFHYRHGPMGLEPLFEKRLLRFERNSLFEENGAIYLSKASVISKESFLGKKIGHIIMNKKESIQIDSEFDFWLAEQMAKSGV